MTISNRVKIGFAFAIVFLLVLATNRLDNRRFNTLENSLTSVFEDRLVAKGYIYELNNIFHDKEKRIMNGQKISNIEVYNDKVNGYINDYYNTRLTSEEKSNFSNFKNHYEDYRDLKREIVTQEGDSMSAATKAKLLDQLNRIQKDLDQLASIQIAEGKSMTQFATRTLDSSSLMSNLEIIIIIVIGIVVQFIIFYK